MKRENLSELKSVPQMNISILAAKLMELVTHNEPKLWLNENHMHVISKACLSALDTFIHLLASFKLSFRLN